MARDAAVTQLPLTWTMTPRMPHAVWRFSTSLISKRALPQLPVALTVLPEPMASDQMVSVSLVWQLGYVEKRTARGTTYASRSVNGFRPGGASGGANLV